MKIGKLKIFEDRSAYEEYISSFAGTLVACIESEDNAIVYGKTTYHAHNFLDIALWDCVNYKMVFVSANDYFNNQEKYLEVINDNQSTIIDDGGDNGVIIKENGSKSDPYGNINSPFIYSLINSNGYMLKYTPIAICVIPSGVFDDNYGTFMMFADYDYMEQTTWESNLPEVEVNDPEQGNYLMTEYHASGLTPRTSITPIINPLDQNTPISQQDPYDFYNDYTIIFPISSQISEDDKPIQSSINNDLWYEGWIYDPEDEKNAMNWVAPIPAVVLDNNMSLNEDLFAQNTSSSSILMDKDGLANTEYLINSSNQEGYSYDVAMICNDMSNNIDRTGLFQMHGSNSQPNIPSYFRKWYIPSIVELMVAMSYNNEISSTVDEILEQLYNIYNNIINNSGESGSSGGRKDGSKLLQNIWSSTEFNDEGVFIVSNGEIYASNKTNQAIPIPFCRIPCLMKEERITEYSSGKEVQIPVIIKPVEGEVDDQKNENK